MYKHYQTQDKLSWLPIKETSNVLQKAIDAGAKKLTILSVSEVIDDSTDKSALKYKGPMYFDIDVKDDIATAIMSAMKLIRKLIALGVPEDVIQVYASGSKGFHVIIPETIFSSGRPVKGLPLLYKEMALYLYVTGMDFQVYCGGKGNSWRVANIKRDNGKYRVPLTCKELCNLSHEEYADTVSRPRYVEFGDPSGVHSPAMAALFDRAKARVKAKPPKATPIPAERLKVFVNEPPQCVLDLAEYKIKGTANFNRSAFQIAIFLARSSLPSTVYDTTIDRFCDAGDSNTYDTPAKRREHVDGLMNYLAGNSTGFSCGGIKSVLQTRPCDDCQLLGKSNDEVDDDVGIVEKRDGYYVGVGDSEKRISTFIIDPVSIYKEESISGHTDRRVFSLLNIVRNDEVVGTVLFNESGWESKSAFKGELRGLNNLSFSGTEDDVHRIKHLVFGEGREMGEIIQVYAAGIHSHKVGTKEVKVYVEPGFSINEMRVPNTHFLSGRIAAPPSVSKKTMPESGDKEIEETLRDLMSMNSPATIAQILGWFCACHLKTHLTGMYSQFPLLNVWGNAGTGKSVTAAVMSKLSGCDYTNEYGPLNVSSITQWAFINYCSTTTTIPRILEEYNQSKMRPSLYNFCGEMMKSAWGGESIGRGTIAKTANGGGGRTGASMVEIPMSSPIVVVSEQAPQMAALQQRSIQVLLKYSDRKGTERRFARLMKNKDRLDGMAKALSTMALITPNSAVAAWMDDMEIHVPNDINSRPKYSYQVLLVGLEFLKAVCNDLNLDVVSHIESLKVALISTLTNTAKEISKAKNKTEVDDVMDDIGVMIRISTDGQEWLTEGTHYNVVNDHLFIDLPVVHALYKRFKRAGASPVTINLSAQFKTLLQQEPYFVTMKAPSGRADGRTMVKLSLIEMEKKGHDISLFR